GVLTFRRNLDYATEERIWEDTVRKRPQNARAWGGIGDAHQRMGDRTGDRSEYEKANRFYRRSLQVNPEQSPMFLNLGHSLEKMGALDEAIDAYTRALRLDPARADGLLNLGHCLEKRDRLPEAIAAYRKAADLDPHDPAYP